MPVHLRLCTCLLLTGGLLVASELSVAVVGDAAWQERFQRSDWTRTWYRLQGSPLADALGAWQQRSEWRALQRDVEPWQELRLSFEPDRAGAACWRGLQVRGDSAVITRARARVAAAWRPTAAMAFLRPQITGPDLLRLGRQQDAAPATKASGLRWRWQGWQGQLQLPAGLSATRPPAGWTSAGRPALLARAPTDTFLLLGLATGSPGWQAWLATLPEQELLDRPQTAGRHRLPPLRQALAGLRGTACLALHPGIYQPAWTLILPDSRALRDWLERAAGHQADRLATTTEKPRPFALWRGLQSIHLAQADGHWLIGTDAEALRRWQRPAGTVRACPLVAELPAVELVGWGLIDLRRLLPYGHALGYLGRRLDWPLLDELGRLGDHLTATVDDGCSRLLLSADDGQLHCRVDGDGGASAILLGLGLYRHWQARRPSRDQAADFRTLCRHLRRDGDWRREPISELPVGWSLASDPDEAGFVFRPWTSRLGPPQWQPVVVAAPDRQGLTDDTTAPDRTGSWVAFADGSMAFIPGRAVWRIARDLPRQAPSLAPIWQPCRWRFARAQRFPGEFDDE